MSGTVLRIAVISVALSWLTGLHPPAVAGAEYALVPGESEVGFRVKFLFGTARGRFDTFSAGAVVENGILLAAHAVIECKSINTFNTIRDRHLRSEHFFSCEAHPLLRFVSTRVTPRGGGRYALRGKLTMRGITHEIELEGELSRSEQGLGYAFQAEGTVNRGDWEITWMKNRRGRNLLIRDRIEIKIEGELEPADTATG